VLSIHLLTPIFKNKGTRQQAINYRGITVLPVIGKIVETVIKCRTNNCVLETKVVVCAIYTCLLVECGKTAKMFLKSINDVFTLNVVFPIDL
jgi:hypothetical protein